MSGCYTDRECAESPANPPDTAGEADFPRLGRLPRKEARV